jgi:aryl-alcohol dehydrogenase-like predicted oxidoreductase
LPELGLLQACKKLGTAFVAFSPLARGALSDVGIDPSKIAENDFRRKIPRLVEPNWGFNTKMVEALRGYAKSRGWSLEALALAWVLHQHDHIIPIPGTRTAEHLMSDAAAADIKLTAADLTEIETILPVGSIHGYRYSLEQQGASEHYC